MGTPELLQRVAEALAARIDEAETAGDVLDTLPGPLIVDHMRSSSGQEYLLSGPGETPAYGFWLRPETGPWLEVSIRVLGAGQVPEAEELAE